MVERHFWFDDKALEVLVGKESFIVIKEAMDATNLVSSSNFLEQVELDVEAITDEDGTRYYAVKTNGRQIYPIGSEFLKEDFSEKIQGEDWISELAEDEMVTLDGYENDWGMMIYTFARAEGKQGFYVNVEDVK